MSEYAPPGGKEADARNAVDTLNSQIRSDLRSNAASSPEGSTRQFSLDYAAKKVDAPADWVSLKVGNLFTDTTTANDRQARYDIKNDIDTVATEMGSPWGQVKGFMGW